MRIENDEQGMRAALEWSARGRGTTSPRPSVGCVLVLRGEIIGGGHTQRGDGNPHGEVMALRAARESGHDTRGATAYVTLEPCSHFGTTPPCTDTLIEAGIARVVAGVRDPNPMIDGRGYQVLREAGIEVIEDFMQPECARAQDHFLKYITTGLPFVTLKIAASLDGKIATKSGESQWISSPASRQRAHQLRADHDAVLVGANTVLADNPSLNVRLESSKRQPARIVLDSRGRLAQKASEFGVFKTVPEFGRTFVAATEEISDEARAVFDSCGAQTVVAPSQDGRVDLAELMKVLPSHQIYSALIEGGSQVAASALKAGIVDKIVFFIAPIILGSDGLNALAPLGIENLKDAPRLFGVQIEQIENDAMISGYTSAEFEVRSAE